MANRIKITYDASEPNRKFDDGFRAIASQLGYLEVGTGFNLKAQKRDLTFEEKPKEEPKAE